MASSTWSWKSGAPRVHPGSGLPAGSFAQLAEIGGSDVGAGVGVGTVGTEGWVGGFAGLSPPPPHTLSDIDATTTTTRPATLLGDSFILQLPLRHSDTLKQHRSLGRAARPCPPRAAWLRVF
jgi:hypothetical protein